MDVFRRFFDILQSIDYYGEHLRKDLFFKEEQHPELLSIFTWFVNNVSQKSNCVTPKELKLYTSISSKCDHYFSLEKVSEAINKFYDKSTKDSVVCSTDLECLEKKILKSQQELNDLNVYGTLYMNKNNLVDREISLLREKENGVKLTSYNIEKDLQSVLRMLTNSIDAFGFSIKKLNDHITDSMINEEKNLIQLSSKNVVNLIGLWRAHIFEMVHTWFNGESILSETNDTYSSKIQMLSLLYQSITALKSAEMIERSEIAKLNFILNNISTIESYYYENNSCLHQNGLDITDFLAKYVQPCKIFISSNEHLASIKYDDLQSRVSDMVITDVKRKCVELESLNTRIIHLHDSIEHYIILCDVLWCLIQTSYSITNLSCELVLRCTEILDKMIEDFEYAREWNSNQINKHQLTNNTTANNYCTASDFSEILMFNRYKWKNNIHTSSDEIAKLSGLIQEWNSKFHFNKTESNQLAAIEEKLQMFNNTINELTIKHAK